MYPFPIFTGSLEICLQSLSNYPGPNISHATQTNVMIFDWRHSMHPCLLNFFVFRKMSIFVTKYVTEVSRRMCFEDSGRSPSVCSSLQKLCLSQRQGSQRRARSSFVPSQTSSFFFDNHLLTLGNWFAATCIFRHFFSFSSFRGALSSLIRVGRIFRFPFNFVQFFRDIRPLLEYWKAHRETKLDIASKEGSWCEN